jgi:hypothetical protein
MGLKQLSVIKNTNYKGGGAAAAGGGGTVAAKNPQFQEGGWIDGPAHSQGGISVNAQGGEYIASQRTMSSSYGPMIVAANQAVNTGQKMQMIDDEHIAMIAAKTMGSIPVIITESSITNKQKEVSIREASFKR